MAVGIEAVDSIPLVHHGPHESSGQRYRVRSSAGAVTKPLERVKEEKPPPDAVPLKTRSRRRSRAGGQRAAKIPTHKRARSESVLQQIGARRYRTRCLPRYEVRARSGRGRTRLKGTIYADYAAQIQSNIERNWNTGSVDARIRTAPVVIADFDLMRDGKRRPISNFPNQRHLHPGRLRPARHPGFESVPSPPCGLPLVDSRLG